MIIAESQSRCWISAFSLVRALSLEYIFKKERAEKRCRLQAYEGAIQRAVERKKHEDGEAHVLDIGTGTGLLAVQAARRGASSVVACDLHASMAAVARRVRSCIDVARRLAGISTATFRLSHDMLQQRVY